MSKSLNEMCEEIKIFSEERGWTNEDPNQLITSIYIELAELAEHYQWKSKFEKWDQEKTTEVGFEFVDVFIYLFRLAKQSGVDLEKFYEMKLPRLAKKFPVGGDHTKAHIEYRKNGKNKLY